MSDVYSKCDICPRNCLVDRRVGTGYCRVGDKIKVARAALHMWEEPCISGSKGSGTVFFSGCNMGCVFCQNRAISRGITGKEITPERLCDIFFELRDKGANNINLVTGDMFLPSIALSIEKAKSRGIDIPFLLNTSSYINTEHLRAMEGLIDIYLPDFKYIRDEDGMRYSRAANYPETAKAAIKEMVRQRGACVFEDRDGQKDILKSGVVVRHLLMPGMVIQAKLIVKYLHDEYGDDVYISLMNQFTPGKELEAYPEINRKVTEDEYDSLVDYASYIGVKNGYIQEGDTAEESFIPDFDCSGV